MKLHRKCERRITILDVSGVSKNYSISRCEILVNIFILSVFHLSTQKLILSSNMKNTTIKIFWVCPKNVE